MPDNNLSLLNYQHRFMRIYDVRMHAMPYFTSIMDTCNNDERYRLNGDKCEYVGEHMEVLRYISEPVTTELNRPHNYIAIMRRKPYRLKCSSNGTYYINEDNDVYEYVKHNEPSDTVSLLKFARHPFNDTAGGLNALQHLLHNEQSVVTSQMVLGLSDYIDRQHVYIRLNNTKTMSDDEVLAKVNSTYVNVVHDCNTLCAQSVLSVSDTWVSQHERKKYSLLCMHKLQRHHTIESFKTDKYTLKAASVTESFMIHDTKTDNLSIFNSIYIAFAILLLIPLIVFLVFNGTLKQNIRNCLKCYSARKTQDDNIAFELKDIVAQKNINNTQHELKTHKEQAETESMHMLQTHNYNEYSDAEHNVTDDGVYYDYEDDNKTQMLDNSSFSVYNVEHDDDKSLSTIIEEDENIYD